MNKKSVSSFAHLHVHTHHSFQDSTITNGALFARCSEYGIKSVAITDHGTISGLPTFYLEARLNGIRPILGCEFYIAPGDRFIKAARTPGKAAFHITLLAMNMKGLLNLVRLDIMARTEGYHYVPRIDKELLAKCSEGLICLTGCFHGEIPHLIATGQIDRAREESMRLREIFGDRLYLEIQDNGIPIQGEINATLQGFSREMDIPLVATNDCHYLDKDDIGNFESLLRWSTGTEFNLEGAELHFKSSQEMMSSFNDFPEAISATAEIANRCETNICLDSMMNTFLGIFGGFVARESSSFSVAPAPLTSQKVKELNELFKEEFGLTEL